MQKEKGTGQHLRKATLRGWKKEEGHRRDKRSAVRVREVERKRRTKTVRCHDSPRRKTFHKERGDSPVNEPCRSRRMKAKIGASQITKQFKESLVIFT